MPTTVQFAVNLRNDTSGAVFVRSLRPWGWLAAPANTTARLRGFAAELGAKNRVFVTDNGNFERIGKIRATLAAASKPLREQVDLIEQQLGRTAVRKDFPVALAQDWDQLAAAAADAARTGIYEPVAGLAVQVALHPTHVIGLEDVTMAALLSLDAERGYLSWPRARFRALNRRVARQAAAVLRQPGAAFAYYAVASGLDYQTGFDAGREFSRAGVKRVAMGFGAYMADDHSTDFLTLRRRTIRFGERLPQRYVRTVAVARGFWDGYEADSGRAPDAFHFLGLGHPILMGLVALVARRTPALSFDAMSPVKDAVEGTLYVSKPAYLKIRTRNVADRFSRDPKVRWNCPCPFCRRFHAGHPADAAAARAWRIANPAAAVDAAVLRPGGPLFAALPFLSEPAGGPLRQAVNEARMGHNHWVLIRICRQMQEQLDRDQLDSFLGGAVKAYAGATAQPRFARAVQFAYDLARGAIDG